MPSQRERRLLKEAVAEKVKEIVTPPELNPFDPTTKKCQKGLHFYDRSKHKQCPECRQLNAAKSSGNVNLTPQQVYERLWRALCRDSHGLEDQTKQGKRLNPKQSKQLLEYLKFLQDVKAMKELEEMEKKHGEGKPKRQPEPSADRPGSEEEVRGSEDEAPYDGEGDQGPGEASVLDV